MKPSRHPRITRAEFFSTCRIALASSSSSALPPLWTSDPKKNETQYGGTWAGRSAIVPRRDGTAATLPVDPHSLTVQCDPAASVYLFTPDPNRAAPWLPGCTVLNPL